MAAYEGIAVLSHLLLTNPATSIANDVGLPLMPHLTLARGIEPASSSATTKSGIRLTPASIDYFFDSSITGTAVGKSKGFVECIAAFYYNKKLGANQAIARSR